MAILWLGFARPHRAVSQQEPTLVPKTVLGTRSSAFGQRTSRKKTRRLQRLSLWRDPDSNRAHHDFQGPADMPGRDGKALQIGRSTNTTKENAPIAAPFPMARPGLEPGTPRFSGTRRHAGKRRKSPANR